MEISALAQALADRGPGYLLTAAAAGRVKAVTVEPDLRDGVLHCPPSGGSARNLATNPAATLLFPPPVERGHTLLVDGTAVAGDDGIAFTPASAVLHRPADHAAGPAGGPAAGAAPADGCGHDCSPVT